MKREPVMPTRRRLAADVVAVVLLSFVGGFWIMLAVVAFMFLLVDLYWLWSVKHRRHLR